VLLRSKRVISYFELSKKQANIKAEEPPPIIEIIFFTVSKVKE